jgi:hypothetical protein
MEKTSEEINTETVGKIELEVVYRHLFRILYLATS